LGFFQLRVCKYKPDPNGAKERRTGSGVFVAINFWDLLCLLVIAAIFDFGVVAISPASPRRAGTAGRFLFAFRFGFAARAVTGDS